MFGTSDINERKLRPVWKYNFFAKIGKSIFYQKSGLIFFKTAFFALKSIV